MVVAALFMGTGFSTFARQRKPGDDFSRDFFDKQNFLLET